jgi:hypothetical protein
MPNLTRTDKKWLIFFALILIGMMGGCMYETVAFHDPIGPKPVIKTTY